MTKERLHDLDWLRVLAFMLLMLYHTAMAFVGWDFHLMNRPSLPELQPLMMFLNQWRLPLLFAISGAGTWFALRNRGLGGFAWERVKRLLLPLLVGMAFIVPPQIYVEYLYKGKIESGYWNFQLSVFELVPYPDGGSLSWHHLWFVVYLFVFAMVSLPLFAYIRSEPGAAQFKRLRVWLSHKAWRLMILVLPLTLICTTLDPIYGETHGLIDDPAALIRYFTLFWLGFLVMGANELRERARQERHVFLFAAAMAFAAQRFQVYNLGDLGQFGTITYFTLRSFYCWFTILAILGYGAQYLNKSNRFLAYANQAVYPFYILHQSVMMILVYLVLPYDWSPWIKFAMILVGMFLICCVLYEIIRRVGILRPLFGLKSMERKQDLTPANTQIITA